MPNSIPSTDVADFLENVKDFDSLCNLTAGAYVDRFGNTRLSVAEFFKRNGYETPVAFASGISVSRVTQTVTYSGMTYHALATAIPFTTTGTFNAAQWELMSGLTRQELGAEYGSGLIGAATYTQLRAYNGDATRIQVGGRANYFDGASGIFVRTGSASDNDGTVIVDALGRSWVRQFSGPVDVRWFGAVGDGVSDDTSPLNNMFNSISNNTAVSLGNASIFRATAPIVIPAALTGLVIHGNGSSIRAAHNGDGLVMVASNENYGRHKVYDLAVIGPNPSYPENELVVTSVGAGLKMGRDSTVSTVAGYLNSFYNCTFSNFKYGVYLQNVILCNWYSGYITFNQFGVYVDAGQTNANTFVGVGIRENRQFGVYSSARTGGSLSAATRNVFYSCEIESNIPYNAATGGYPSVFDPTTGHGVKLHNSYDWVFDKCYFENHNYSVVIDSTSDDNRFDTCRFDGGGAGGFRPGSVVINGANCSNNTFIGCKMVDYVGYAEGTFQVLSATSTGNQLIDCTGFSFNPSYILAWPHIRNHQKSQGSAGAGQSVGFIQMPSQGFVNNPGAGTAPGEISGIGTASATLHAFGCGEIQFGNNITANTVITAIDGVLSGQVLVLRNYQSSHAVTIKNGGGTGDLVLNGDAVFTTFGQHIVLYVASGLPGPRCYEIGRNF